VTALAIEPGDTVADLGSGSGYFTLRLAEATGASGRVLAVDVDADMNELVTERAREAGVANVETVLAQPDDPKLPEGAVDLVFTCNTYHHLEERPAYFARLRRALAPGGRVAIVEYREQAFLLRRHATPPDVIRSEMETAGYRLVADHDFLERQSFLVFAPEEGGGA
jgi:arsenite methyltransferase